MWLHRKCEDYTFSPHIYLQLQCLSLSVLPALSGKGIGEPGTRGLHVGKSRARQRSTPMQGVPKYWRNS